MHTPTPTTTRRPPGAGQRWDDRVRQRRAATLERHPRLAHTSTRLARVRDRAADVLLAGTTPRSQRAVVIALTIADAVATWWWLTLHVAREGNPILDAAIGRYGLVATMTGRVVVGVVLAVGLVTVAERHRGVRLPLALMIWALLAVGFIHLAASVRLLTGNL